MTTKGDIYGAAVEAASSVGAMSMRHGLSFVDAMIGSMGLACHVLGDMGATDDQLANYFGCTDRQVRELLVASQTIVDASANMRSFYDAVRGRVIAATGPIAGQVVS